MPGGGHGRGQEGFERPDSDVVDAELADIVLPFVKSKGAKSLGMLGFCFGGAVAMRASTTDAFAGPDAPVSTKPKRCCVVA